MQGIVELLSTETANSAFHATRLDVEHISGVVESLVASAERRSGFSRMAMAPETVFISHETYTPARGGSAAAEVTALRKVFGPAANQIPAGVNGCVMGSRDQRGVLDAQLVTIFERAVEVLHLREVIEESPAQAVVAAPAIADAQQQAARAKAGGRSRGESLTPAPGFEHRAQVGSFTCSATSLPSASSTSRTSGIWPIECVAQLRQGS